LLAALVVLVRLRPERPSLPSSLSSPVNTGTVQELVLVALWIATGLLLVTFLVRTVATTVARAPRVPLAPVPEDRLAPRRRSRPLVTRPAFPPPFPLTPRGGEQHCSPRTLPRRNAAPTIAEARLSIALLGRIEVTAAAGALGLRSRTNEILAYLALNPTGALTDELAAALLPRTAKATARRRIWRSINEARTQLGDILPRSGDHYVLNRAAVAIDIDEFDHLLSRATGAPAAERAVLLERAATLVRGEPLAGCAYAWAAGDVRRLRARIVGLLHELSEIRLARGDAAAALTFAERALEFDADDERAHRLAMQAESALGLREAVAERYERLSKSLDRRFGLEPDQETRLLHRSLLSQDPPNA
jgi:DNA-binding SARP family transcriptional activator